MSTQAPSTDASPDSPRHRRVLLAAVALSLITFLVFSPSLRNGFVNFDDYAYITRNDWVLGGLSFSSMQRALTTGEMSNWHPLTWLSYLIDVSLYGLNPVGHHFTSLWLHSLNAALALLCAVALTGRLVVAFPAATLFALHPLRVESVTWIAERKDVLSGVFFFATILLWVSSSHRQGGALRAAALVSFAVGLLAKPMLVTLPALLIVIEILFLQRPVRTVRDWISIFWDKTPFFLLAAASSLVTVLVQKDAMSDVESYGVFSRIAGMPVHVVEYLKLTVWPIDLSAMYPLDRDGYGALTVAGATLLLVVVTGAAFAFRRSAPVLLGGWLWFVGTLFPVLGLLHTGEAAVADRYTYLPHLGLFLSLSWAATMLSRAYGPLCLVAVAAGLCFLTVDQIPVWSSGRTLFQHAVDNGPISSFSHDSLAGELLEAGDIEGAEHHAELAHSISPDNARIANRLAQVLAVKGENDKAEALLWTTVKRHPDSAKAWFYLSVLERKDGRADDAREHLLRALELSRGKDERLHNQVLGIAIGAGFISPP